MRLLPSAVLNQITAASPSLTVDWTIPIGVIFLALVQIAGFVLAAARIYYGMREFVTAKFNTLNLDLVTWKTQQLTDINGLKALLLADIARLASDARDANGRIERIEAGSDEWTKTIRERTHDLANQVNTLILRVDRLERPLDGHT